MLSRRYCGSLGAHTIPESAEAADWRRACCLDLRKNRATTFPFWLPFRRGVTPAHRRAQENSSPPPGHVAKEKPAPSATSIPGSSAVMILWMFSRS